MRHLIYRLSTWIALKLFRVEVTGLEHLKVQGPAVLAPNHVSWLDAALIYACTDMSWKFVVSKEVATSSKFIKLFLEDERSFFIDPASPFAMRDVARFLQTGGKLVLFPEGSISYTGRLRKLYEGIGFLMMRTGATVVPCFLQGAERTIFARQTGWKRLFQRVRVHFAPPIQAKPYPHMKPVDARARHVTAVRDVLLELQYEKEFAYGAKNLAVVLNQMARFVPNRKILEDAAGGCLSYRKMVVGSDLLGGKIAGALAPEERRVAVLLPNVNAMVVTLLGLWRFGREAAILNFSSGPGVMLTCARLADIKTVVTSRAFLQRSGLQAEPFLEAGIRVLYLEDLRAAIPKWRPLAALLRQIFVPANDVGLGERELSGEATAVILFTSGSEGTPKGVELTHANLVANLWQAVIAVDFDENDKMFNALPMFHSFGLTIGTLLPLVRGIPVYVYPTPLHYRIIPAAVYNTRATILLGTNTFLYGYARKANPYDFVTVRRVFLGAEKLQEATAKLWIEKFGVRVLEAYGATETSPGISFDTPFAPKRGTVGRPLPGLAVRVEPVAGVEQGGKLLVRGRNIMKGYLNPEPNARFQALGGWYDTGDIVSIDDEGYITILGRLKRFAKVSGEMVSLTAVEDAIAQEIAERVSPRAEVVVTSVPDADKGEMLVAVANLPEVTTEVLRQILQSQGLSLLCAPKRIVTANPIPKLGSGKTDYQQVQKVVAEAFAAGEARY
jgi:acyl-[acyl-carrier-protein]-phospholipid O-acyltransferase/long-chain-fatty-acid--[acyl-carrier-protein] ligase